MAVNLSLYLVTDSTPAILKGRDLCNVVEESLKGGEFNPLEAMIRLDAANCNQESRLSSTERSIATQG